MGNNICLEPVFNDKNAICFACDDKFVPYFLIALTSLYRHTKKQNNYEIVILETKISEKNKNVIMSYSKSNIKIRFVDMDEYLKNFDTSIFYTSTRFTIHTYYRFFITDIFKNYKKVLYLDSDIVLTTDINKIFEHNLDNCYVGATRDIYLPMITNIDSKLKNYFLKILGLSDIKHYFQAGVLMFNIPYCIKNDLKNKLINRLKEVKTPFIVDQDILNSVCENNVEYIDGAWNFDTNVLILDSENKNLIKNTYNEQEQKVISQLQRKPKIIHYAGHIKPWNTLQVSKSLEYWKYVLFSKCSIYFLKRFLRKYIRDTFLIFYCWEQ